MEKEAYFEVTKQTLNDNGVAVGFVTIISGDFNTLEDAKEFAEKQEVSSNERIVIWEVDDMNVINTWEVK